MKKLKKELITSFLTVILAILAIGLFIYSGGSAAFYVVVVMALLVGFYNAWQISHEPEMETKTAPRRARQKRR